MKAGVAILVLAGCSNLMKAQPPMHRFDDAHAFGATALAFSPEGTLLASGGLKGEVSLWQVAPPKRISTLHQHRDAVRALQFVAGGSLVSGSEEGELVLWDVGSRNAIAARKTPAVSALALADGVLFSGHADGVRRWRPMDLAQAGEPLLMDAVVAIAVNGNVLAIADSNGGIALYDTSLRRLQQVQASGETAHDLRFSPDGKRLFAGGWFRVFVWDLEKGERKVIATEHNGLIASLDVSHDGERLASLGRHTDSAIRVWQAHDFKIERRYQAHDLCGAMIRFSPDGRYIASASDDESVRLYDLRLP